MHDFAPTSLFGLSSLLLIVLSLPLAQRRVRPNGVYGFRTSATLSDDKVWYEVNAKTGLDLLLIGVGLGGLTLAHVAGAFSALEFAAIGVAWLLGGVSGTKVHGAAIARRLQVRE